MRKKRIFLFLFTFIALVCLGVMVLNDRLQLIKQGDIIADLAADTLQLSNRITNLRSDSLELADEVYVIKRSLQQADSVNKSQKDSLDCKEKMLAGTISQLSLVTVELRSYKNQLANEINLRRKSEEQNRMLTAAINRLRIDNYTLRAEMDGVAVKSANLEELKKTFSNQIAVFLSGLDHPEVQLVYQRVKPYVTSVSRDELEYIYGVDGMRFRRIARSSNLLPESLLQFLKSQGLDPYNVSERKVRSVLNNVFQGDFKRLAITLYGCERDEVERTSKVIQSFIIERGGI